MPLSSVDPNNIQPNGATGAMDSDRDYMSPPNTAIPQPNPVDQSALNTNQLNKLTQTTQQGDQAIAAAAKSSGKGGSSVGGIFGAVGSILGGLFSQGGMVGGDKLNGFADGGQVSDPKNDMLAAGYLIGALHQGKFGGTPDTLEKAAAAIKQMLGNGKEPQGLASGGSVNSMNPDTLAEQSLTKALGLGNPQQQPQSNAQQMPQQAPTNQASQLPQGMQNAMAGGNPNQMRGYAAGGPPMPQQAPQQSQGMMQKPPGQEQEFEGDGEVKGPGGPTDDAIPARLSNGEFVMSAPATAFFGVDKLVKMNDQGKQGFMQAKGQVEANQQQGPGGAPQQPPAMPPAPQGMMQPPMMQAKGGPAVMRTKGTGYCGL